MSHLVSTGTIPTFMASQKRQCWGGASGAVVVGGIENIEPAVSGLRQRILMIRDQPQVQGLAEGAGGGVNVVPFQDVTVNDVPSIRTSRPRADR